MVKIPAASSSPFPAESARDVSLNYKWWLLQVPSKRAAERGGVRAVPLARTAPGGSLCRPWERLGTAIRFFRIVLGTRLWLLQHPCRSTYFLRPGVGWAARSFFWKFSTCCNIILQVLVCAATSLHVSCWQVMDRHCQKPSFGWELSPAKSSKYLKPKGRFRSCRLITFSEFPPPTMR